MPGVDLSEFQDPMRMPYGSFDFAIVRASHGLVEDKHWRQHVWNLGVAGKPFGFYHALEANPADEARFFKGLVMPFAHTMGDWLDIARGDLNPALISTATVDAFRAVFDTGIYVNQSAIDAMPEYKRFERIWYAWIANSPPPGRWLMWQYGQAFGIDVNHAADLGGGVGPSWSAFSFPGA